MNQLTNKQNRTIYVPGDKSISHRAVIMASLTEGKTVIRNFLFADDCMRTVEAFRALGVTIYREEEDLIVQSGGAHSFKQPTNPIYLGNSGTTARLLLGVLSALPFKIELTGDESLSKRPMKRVTEPLQKMGAEFKFLNIEGHLPIQVQGAQLKPIQHELSVASAQVKSALLLAALTANVEITVIEKAATRDHTERIFKLFGVQLSIKDRRIELNANQSLKHVSTINVPGDFSSAAYWIVLGILSENEGIRLGNVGLNSTRTGLLDVLKTMGADIRVVEDQNASFEPVGMIEAFPSKLSATVLEEDEVPKAIDEIPLIALAATQAEGSTLLQHIEELRYKETDRISAVVNALRAIGSNVEATRDQMTIHGPTKLTGGKIITEHDHRIAMLAGIASKITEDPIKIDERGSVEVSYPNFFDVLNQL